MQKLQFICFELLHEPDLSETLKQFLNDHKTQFVFKYSFDKRAFILNDATYSKERLLKVVDKAYTFLDKVLAYTSWDTSPDLLFIVIDSSNNIINDFYVEFGDYLKMRFKNCPTSQLVRYSLFLSLYAKTVLHTTLTGTWDLSEESFSQLIERIEMSYV